MSINTPGSSSEVVNQVTTDIIEIPSNIKEQVKQETKAELTKLDADMQKISHDKFLADVDFANRLKHITDPNIDASDLSKDSKIEFNFSFTSEEINPILFQRTTAWQVLPVIVKLVIAQDGKTYSRTSEKWEFFAEDGKRLKIYDKTQITIWELRDEGDYDRIKAEKEQMLTSQLVDNTNRELITMSSEKWINPSLVLKVFAAFFGTSDMSKVDEWEYEDFLTQVDREIGYMNMDEKRADKNNLSQESQDELIARMGDQTSMDSIDYQMEDFAELQALAIECGIRKPEFLYAIWELESSCGRNVNSRQESRGRESLGMFQILNVNLPDELVYELKNNPSDKDINIRALRYFINNNLDLVDAINNNNYEQVASIYNGRGYDNLATKNGWTPYDDKLRNSVAGYYDRVNYSMVA